MASDAVMIRSVLNMAHVPNFSVSSSVRVLEGMIPDYVHSVTVTQKAQNDIWQHRKAGTLTEQ